MRATLEQLKAMSDEELKSWWLRGQFPFESLKTCSKCLTEHGQYAGDAVYGCGHEGMIAEILALGPQFRYRPSGAALRESLEQLYALRLFYDSLYPQEAETTPSLPDAVAMNAARPELVGEKI